MFYVYLIKSEKSNFFYKGFYKDLEKRLQQHNNGSTKSNKAYAPFYVLYYEKCPSIKEAVIKEKYWKSAAGRRYLKNKINLVPSFNG